MVCGLALFGTVGGATKFLLDFPEPCQLALQVAEKDEVVEELLGKPFKRQLWWEGHITPSTAQVLQSLDNNPRLCEFNPASSLTGTNQVRWLQNFSDPRR